MSQRKIKVFSTNCDGGLAFRSVDLDHRKLSCCTSRQVNTGMGDRRGFETRSHLGIQSTPQIN